MHPGCLASGFDFGATYHLFVGGVQHLIESENGCQSFVDFILCPSESSEDDQYDAQ